MFTRFKSWPFSFFVIALTGVLLLSACGDKEAEQQKEFTDFLHNTVLRGGHQIPALSENQRRKFGRFTEDYTILFNASQQIRSALTTGVMPLFNLIERIKVPEDYLHQNEILQKTQATLMLLNQQLQSDRIRIERDISMLKQSEALKTVYLQVYHKVVSQPLNTLLPQIQQLDILAQSVIQVGDFLREQGDQVSYANEGIQLYSEQAVSQYNALMAKVKIEQQVLPRIHQILADQQVGE